MGRGIILSLTLLVCLGSGSNCENAMAPAEMLPPAELPNVPPVASLVVTEGPRGASTQIVIDSTSHDPDGEIAEYHWFVNGEPLSDLGPHFSFIPNDSGTFMVRLEVVDNDGAVDATETALFVRGPHHGRWEGQIAQDSPQPISFSLSSFYGGSGYVNDISKTIPPATMATVVKVIALPPLFPICDDSDLSRTRGTVKH